MIAELNAVLLGIFSVAVASVMELTLHKGISKSSWSEVTKCMLAYLLCWFLSSLEWSLCEFMQLVRCSTAQSTTATKFCGCFWRSLIPWKQCCQL